MCDNVIYKNPHALKFVPDYYMTQKMCDKTVDIHPSTTKFVA